MKLVGSYFKSELLRFATLLTRFLLVIDDTVEDFYTITEKEMNWLNYIESIMKLSVIYSSKYLYLFICDIILGNVVCKEVDRS